MEKSCFDVVFVLIQGIFQKIRACMWYNQKRATKFSKKAQLWVFTPHFSIFRAFRMLHPLNSMCFLSFQKKKREKHVLFLNKSTVCGYRTQQLVKKSPVIIFFFLLFQFFRFCLGFCLSFILLVFSQCAEGLTPPSLSNPHYRPSPHFYIFSERPASGKTFPTILPQ